MITSPGVIHNGYELEEVTEFADDCFEVDGIFYTSVVTEGGHGNPMFTLAPQPEGTPGPGLVWSKLFENELVGV